MFELSVRVTTILTASIYFIIKEYLSKLEAFNFFGEVNLINGIF